MCCYSTVLELTIFNSHVASRMSKVSETAKQLSNFCLATRRHFFVVVATLLLPLPVAISGELSPTDQINSEISKQWNENGITASEEATAGEWARRVYLDLLGRIPSTKELRAFEKDSRKPDARRRLVQKLIYDDAYTVEFARNWATLWTNILVGRNGGNERNSLINRDGMQKYLRDSFARNRPYDAMVRDLLTADGTNKPGEDNFNGAVNFLSMKLNEKAAQATADTSRIFLGKQVQCTQCHDHPFNEWKQNQFWELNAFFRQTVPLRRFEEGTNMVTHVHLTDQDFAGEGTDPDEAEVYFELRDATLQAAYPKFINGKEINKRSGRLEAVNRRQELAKFVVESQELPRAIVNRMWGHFFNHGFTTPVDDMGPHNPPTHPELLDYLAQQLVANSFDLRLLMEWIATSDPYALSSRMGKKNRIDDPSKGERPLFSHYYVRQMRAEELFDSLITATRADRMTNRNKIDETRREWLKQFVIAFGNDEGTEGSTFNGSITQALVLFNGQLTRRALSDKPNSMLYRLAAADASFEAKVNQLMLASVARRATKREQQAAQQLVMMHGGKQLAGLQDLWWAVLNSNEFILNH